MHDNLDSNVINALARALEPAVTKAVERSLERMLKDVAIQTARSADVAALRDDRRLLTVKEAAQHLSISKSTLWLRVKSGELPLYSFGPRTRRVRLEDVEARVRTRS